MSGKQSPERLPDQVTAILTSRVLWAVYGVAMAAMAMNLPEWQGVSVGKVVGLVVLGGLGIAGAHPYTGRQVVSTSHLHHNLVIHRNTLLAAVYVMIIAGAHPHTPWVVGVDAALLAGYLLLLDAVVMPAPVLRRLAGPVPLLSGVALTGVSLALVSAPATDDSLRTALAAVSGVAVLATAMVTGFRVAETRRVRSRGTEPPKPDRPPR